MVMEGTLQLVTTLQSAKSSPESMIGDVSHVCNVLKSDSARVDDLDQSLLFLETLKKNPGQPLVRFLKLNSEHFGKL